MEQTVLFPGVKDGDVFNVGGLEFIKFPDVDGKTPAVLKGIVFRSRFGKNGNFAESEILKRLNEEILPTIVEAVGEENVCSFVTNLTTLDGLKTYGSVEGKISLPTVDFYRAHPEIFGRYLPGGWWWLATAGSAAPRNPDWPWACCVAPSGSIDYDNVVGVSNGVRPFCIFKSFIFGSSES